MEILAEEGIHPAIQACRVSLQGPLPFSFPGELTRQSSLAGLQGWLLGEILEPQNAIAGRRHRGY